MLCCTVYGEAVSIMSCLANKRRNNGGFAARRLASTQVCGAHVRMSDKMPRRRSHKYVSVSPGAYTICTRKTHTHTHSKAAMGQGTYCHTHCLKCHTQASLGVWRAEGSCQVGGRFVPPDTACRICWKGAHTHTHTQRKVRDPVTQ